MPDSAPESPTVTREQRLDRLVFYPVALAGGVFCITTLMIIAATFGDPQVPVSRWLNDHGAELLLWETAALVGLGVLAMGIDRVRTLRRLRNRVAVTASSPEDSTPKEPSPCG